MKIKDLKVGAKYAYKKGRYDEVGCAQVLSTTPLALANAAGGLWSSRQCHERRAKKHCTHTYIDHGCYTSGKGQLVHVSLKTAYMKEPADRVVYARFLKMTWEDHEREAKVKRAERQERVRGEIETLQQLGNTWEEIETWIPFDEFPDLARIARENSGALDWNRLDEDWLRRDTLHRRRKVDISPDELLRLLKAVAG